MRKVNPPRTTRRKLRSATRHPLPARLQFLRLLPSSSQGDFVMAMHKYVAAIVTSLVGLSLVWAADWPQFLGPNRNGSSPETGLLTTWPADGPKVLWKVE